jgi:TrmH family RNA methyltransferase
MITKQELKFIKSLHQKKFRDESGLYIAEGIKIVQEAVISNSHLIENVFISSKLTSQTAQLFSNQGIKVREMAGAALERITALKSPQGILAVLRKPEMKIPLGSELGDLTLLLDQISDPGNMGTIIRIADWFGISNIICSENTVDCFNPKVVQSSMGSIFRVKISYSGLSSFIVQQRKLLSNLIIYGTSLDGIYIYNAPLQTPAFVLLGNEANGLSSELLNLTDNNVQIPNYSKSIEKTESLNVSIAAAIICSEFRKQSG